MKKLYSLIFLVLPFIVQSQEITTDTVYALSTCAGQRIVVAYSTSGINFLQGNKFDVQMSNGWGSFNNPTVIGSSNFNAGFILATVPETTPFGFYYRIRVVSTNPGIIGSPAPNSLIITSFPQAATITPSSQEPACYGDSVTLSVLQAQSYKWSTGETTQTIWVKTAGKYWVKIQDFAGCDASDTIEVAFKECNLGFEGGSENFGVKVYPNPAKNKIGFEMPFALANIKIHSLSGRELLDKEIRQHEELNISHLSPGVYFITISGPAAKPARIEKLVKL
jgi:hypothetical protein